MNLRSDNEAPVAPEILDAIIQCNTNHEPAYGNDTYTLQLNQRFSEVFEHDVAVFPVISGTAANSIALANICPPYGAVFCTHDAHIHTDECGAPEFYNGGAKLFPIESQFAKLSAESLTDCLANFGYKGDQEPIPSALSLTQVAEMGCVYSIEQIEHLTDIARSHSMHVHMDGARFANALVSLQCSPAEATWKAGIDILSFGATKNGAMAAEAIVVFNSKLVDGIRNRRMKGGHLISKMRYVSAQLIAYLDNNLWLSLALRANQAAQHIANQLNSFEDIKLLHSVDANEIFLSMPSSRAQQLSDRGLSFHPWPGKPNIYRMVSSWNTGLIDIRT